MKRRRSLRHRLAESLYSVVWALARAARMATPSRVVIWTTAPRTPLRCRLARWRRRAARAVEHTVTMRGFRLCRWVGGPSWRAVEAVQLRLMPAEWDVGNACFILACYRRDPAFWSCQLLVEEWARTCPCCFRVSDTPSHGIKQTPERCGCARSAPEAA